MEAFTLDTSGHVKQYDNAGGLMGALAWSDLSPFTQGYIEALFASACKGFERAGFFMPYEVQTRRGFTNTGVVGFSDLAPETLARIIADCERLAHDITGEPSRRSERVGAAFWAARNGDTFEDAKPLGLLFAGRIMQLAKPFPPLTPYLGDDGRVYLREASDERTG